MKKVLVLGAGLVVKPLVDYFLSQSDIELSIASRSGDKGILAGRPRSQGLVWKTDDLSKLKELISEHDLVISLLPAEFHPTVAEIALQSHKPMMTTSYISPKMRSLDNLAREKDLLLLNECGVDPGMDHMSAMKIINSVREKGGKITEFISYCGGLPAPEACDNPLNYKFSWSPKGVLIAATNPAKFLKKGRIEEIPGDQLFYHCEDIQVEGVGTFQGYPNRDSTVYQDIYQLDEIRTLFRGTLRYPGHCKLWSKMVKMGLFSQQPLQFDDSSTYKDLMVKLIPGSTQQNIKEELARYFNISEQDEVIEKLEWLDLFSDRRLKVTSAAPIDLVTEVMKEKMPFKPEERDMLVMKHLFRAEYPEHPAEEITSTFVFYGTPGGDSAMAQTVSLPVAIAAKLYLDGKIKMSGVWAPVKPEIYLPILQELEKLGMTFEEKEKTVE
ncbi:MAG: saccharopine dehydrogenase C-terminal domain-containing protein [bacterium]